MKQCPNCGDFYGNDSWKCKSCSCPLILLADFRQEIEKPAGLKIPENFDKMLMDTPQKSNLPELRPRNFGIPVEKYDEPEIPFVVPYGGSHWSTAVTKPEETPPPEKKKSRKRGKFDFSALMHGLSLLLIIADLIAVVLFWENVGNLFLMLLMGGVVAFLFLMLVTQDISKISMNFLFGMVISVLVVSGAYYLGYIQEDFTALLISAGFFCILCLCLWKQSRDLLE